MCSMARRRSPERDKAKQMWLESGGTMKLKDIAAALSIPESRVRKWKAVDRWQDELNGSAEAHSKWSEWERSEVKGSAQREHKRCG